MGRISGVSGVLPTADVRQVEDEMKLTYDFLCPDCKGDPSPIGGTTERLEARCPVCRNEFIVLSPKVHRAPSRETPRSNDGWNLGGADEQVA